MRGKTTPYRLSCYAAIGLALVLLALALRWYVGNVQVHDFVQRNLGRLEARAGVQAFTLHGPRKGDLLYPDSIALSVEFRGQAIGGPQPEGRYRLTIKDGDEILLQSQGGRREWCNWHRPWQGAVLDLDAAGTDFAMPVPGRRYVIEFEWLDIPNGQGNMFLYWAYPSRLGFGTR